MCGAASAGTSIIFYSILFCSILFYSVLGVETCEHAALFAGSEGAMYQREVCIRRSYSLEGALYQREQLMLRCCRADAVWTPH